MDSESAVSQGQRKIELQSPEDLSYLVTNVRNAAAARLNEAFPQVQGHDGEDELRNQIEKLVNEVCASSPTNPLYRLVVLFRCADQGPNSSSTSTRHSPSPHPASP